MQGIFSQAGIRVIESDSELTAVRRKTAAKHSPVDTDSIGYYLDVQTARLQALAREGVSVERRDDHLLIVMPGTASFASDSALLKSNMLGLLDDLSTVLQEFNKSLIFIGGHSDSLGDSGYNLYLSRQRALAVGTHLSKVGIDSWRLVVRGFGDAKPIATNDTESGRAGNRRIELTVWPLVAEDVAVTQPSNVATQIAMK
ncbi:OmpA family protein [Luminiphilus syltensis NOR5-1B]|uniref:OmpA family protein n=1 Tax=Luminiphilus syltensis NOR5-1B TaxID=565045 RepID=B8KTI8_9GAMM|nr:OmpA family protein [Luminiphilus syltensis]EED36030.1 OmpA family protein [Luminiphilus syltensis NOR5-1B]